METGMRRYEQPASGERPPAKVTLRELVEMGERMYGDLVKADVDIAKGVLLLGMELHADGEAVLLETGSHQEDIWGINLYPEHYDTEEFIEFDSMINIRPRQGNRTPGVEDPTIQQRIREIVLGAIEP